MTAEQAFDIVAETIAAEFRVDRTRVRRETVAADLAGWDSFSHGVLIMAIEENLNVMLPIDRLLEAADVGELVDIVVQAVK